MHDYDPGRRIGALFQTLPGASFTVDGARAPEDAALLSAAAEIRLANGVRLVLEVKGENTDRDRVKREFMGEWIDAVKANNFTDRSDNFKGMMTFDGFTARVEYLW